MLLPKKSKEDRAKEKAARKKAKPLTKRAKNQKNANSSYWVRQCDELFMIQGRGRPCEICGTDEGTVFHHHVTKSTCKALRYDMMNMVVLCPQHHGFSNEISAHSTNAYAQRKYMEWMEDSKADQYKYCEEHQHNRTRFKYKELYSKFKDLSDNGQIVERKVNDCS